MGSKALDRLSSGGSIALLCALTSMLLGLLAAPSLARTAPQYEDSEPGAGSSVQAPPGIVSVTFSEPLDESSTMTVVNECNERVDGGNVVVEFDEMRIDVAERHYSGTYTVGYSAVGIGGITGTNKGSFSFDAAEGHSCDDGGGKKHHHGKKKKEHEHDPGENKGNEHEHGGPQDEHDDHDDMTSHDGTDHSGMSDHSSMTGDHGNHDATTGSNGHSEHSSDGAPDRHDTKHGDGHTPNGSPRGSFASGPLDEIPADGRAAAIALALCAGLGIIGGMFLRSSAR